MWILNLICSLAFVTLVAAMPVDDPAPPVVADAGVNAAPPAAAPAPPQPDSDNIADVEHVAAAVVAAADGAAAKPIAEAAAKAADAAPPPAAVAEGAQAKLEAVVKSANDLAAAPVSVARNVARSILTVFSAPSGKDAEGGKDEPAFNLNPFSFFG